MSYHKTKTKQCRLVGVPVQDGAGRLGCEMGPSAYRTAGIAKALSIWATA